MHAYLLPLELEEGKVEKKMKDGTKLSVTIWPPRATTKSKRSPPSLETLVAVGIGPRRAQHQQRARGNEDGKWTLKERRP
jgi:hypothetical protein